MDEIATYLSRIETTIGRNHIEAWRNEEAIFREAVVDIKNHKDLKNIYEPPAEACKNSVGAMRTKLTKFRCSFDDQRYCRTANGRARRSAERRWHWAYHEPREDPDRARESVRATSEINLEQN